MNGRSIGPYDSSLAAHSPFADLLWTVRFLSIVPAGRGRGYVPADMWWALLWFPWVGVGLGVATAALCHGFAAAAPASLAAALALACYVALTRGLHLDGLADTLDGFLGGWDREARLRIMRDSSVGTFGVCGIVGALGLRYAALSTLDVPFVLFGLAAMPLVGRWSQIFGMVFSRYAREGEGLGRMFCEQARGFHLMFASVLVCAVLLAGFGGTGLALFVGLGVANGLCILVSRRMLGGVTGDVLGAMSEISEVLFLLACAAASMHGLALVAYMAPVGGH